MAEIERGDQRIGFTDHAIGRYQDRVKPLASRDQAIRELRALLDQGELLDERPWNRGDEIEQEELARSDGYVVLAPGIIAPVIKRESGQLIAITVLTNRAYSDQRKERRKDAKAAHRRHRRPDHRYFLKGKRMSKKPKWS